MKIKFCLKSLLIICLTFLFIQSGGQESPLYPISYRLFTPFIVNPAIAGSKDFSTIDFQASKSGDLSSQILSSNMRLTKSRQSYFTSHNTPEFTKIGVGGTIFNDPNETSRIVGISGTGSYHFQLDKNSLSFFSVGATAKALFNNYKGDPDQSRPEKNTILPNLDFGIYFYNPFLFAGLSVTNMLGSQEDTTDLGYSTIPVSPHYYFNIGGKIVLSRDYNILLEPSVYIISDDTFSQEISEMIKPAIKLYAGNLCVGTYFNDFDNTSFFFQYKYSRFHIGAYFEFQRKTPFYQAPPSAELIFGINLSALKPGISQPNHW